MAQDPDADLQDIEGCYTKPGGVFRVLTSDEGAIVGCGGLYPLANGEAEIRKAMGAGCSTICSPKRGRAAVAG